MNWKIEKHKTAYARNLVAEINERYEQMRVKNMDVDQAETCVDAIERVIKRAVERSTDEIFGSTKV